MIGPLVHSACNSISRKAFQAAGRNFHAEKLAAEGERTAIYYVAVFAEIERCRVAQVPTLIGERSIPREPTTDLPYGVRACIDNERSAQE